MKPGNIEDRTLHLECSIRKEHLKSERKLSLYKKKKEKDEKWIGMNDTYQSAVRMHSFAEWMIFTSIGQHGKWN